ncbi:MAG: two-component sensor histidine kinase [Ignavibacteria bacterium RBG_13_36_8]|nr:MAG: two-component sensor histidine kinase [Ignavibacteria bacterium RBG_13_36_8]
MIKKIGFKLILAVGITTIVTVGVYSYYNIQSQNEVLLSEVERHANQLSETVKKSTRYDMLANRRESIHNIINTIGEDNYIASVRVLNKEGEIIYSSNPNDIGLMVDKKTESCYACHAADQPLQRLSIPERTRIFKPHPDSASVMGVINPIYNEKSCWEAECHAHRPEQTVLGVLDVTISLKEVEQQITASQIKVVLYAIFAIISLSLIIALFVKRWVDKPVNELVKATNQVAVGNLNYMIKNSSKDELGSLANSFNNMTKKLSEMRMQLFQSDKLASLGQLAAGVAHEINNPLTGVLTYSSYLQKRMKDNPEVLEDLNVIVRETKRSREIVKELLDFARQSTPKKSLLDINETIDRAVAVVANQLKIIHINLEKKFDPNIPKITADGNQIQQVFLNLLVNSIDAIGENGGTITISSSIIRLSPYGITQIKNATCSNGHSLIDNKHNIEGFASIKLRANLNGNEGFIYLDPIYGKQRNHYDILVMKNHSVHLSCPECKVSLVDINQRCPECGSTRYNIIIPDNGVLEGCTRLDCHWQKWDFIDSGGKQKFVEIKFADSGCGISKENLNKIFDPFFSTKGQKGTGLGLSVIWGIIDNHDGKISVESEVGIGTTFTVRLPIGNT